MSNNTQSYSHNIDNYYDNIKLWLKTLEAFTEYQYIADIFKMCRLKPIDAPKYSTHNYYRTAKLYKHWIDEYHNSVKIIYKDPQIIYNDLSIKQKQCTDLYYGLSFDKIIKISKLALILIGKDEDYNKDCCLISFLGLDNYLRTYLLMYEEWKQISSLYLGFKNLEVMARNLQVSTGFYKLELFENRLPCQNCEGWLTSLPGNSDFYEMLKKEHEFLFYKLKGY